MPAPSNAICNSFKQELFQKLHDFTASTGNAFKIALYKATASVAGTHGAADTAYASMGSDELATAGGYTAGGTALTNVTPSLSGSTAIVTFSPNPNWTSATFTSSGGMIYNTTNSNRAVTNHYWGSDQAVVAGTFTVQFPTADASNAYLRLA
jgi:hypothetical protein